MHLFTTDWDDVSAESINANCWKGLEDVFPAPVNDSNSAFDRFHETDLREEKTEPKTMTALMTPIC